VPWLTSASDGARIRLRVLPRASRTEIGGVHGDTLRVRLQAPPVEGKANRALLRFLAGQLGLRTRDLVLESGAKGRDKTVFVKGGNEAELRQRLEGRVRD